MRGYWNSCSERECVCKLLWRKRVEILVTHCLSLFRYVASVDKAEVTGSSVS